MNDDDRSVRGELASAYLDNELDPSERAVAANDPEVMRIVTAYAALRSSVSDVTPAPEATRDSAIAAALTMFDAARAQAPAPPATAPGVLTMLRRRRTQYAYRLVGFAAAGLVGVVAVAALMSGRGEDQKSSATAPAAATDSGQRNKAAPAETESPGILSIEAAGTAAIPAVDTPEALLAYAAGQTSLAADSAATLPSGTPAPAGGGASAETVAAAQVPAAAAPCVSGNEVMLGEISVLGAPAYAVRDASTGEVRAVAQADCRVLFAVTP